MKFALLAWVFSLAAIVGYKLLIGRITLQGLLTHDGVNFSPERGQLLLATVVSVAAYAQQALASGAMVDPSNLVLSGAAGSQALYVVGKYLRQILTSGGSSIREA
jgi:hypothetical protein